MDIFEDEQTIKAPFNVRAENKEFTMYVILEKQGQDLIVVSYEMVKDNAY